MYNRYIPQPDGSYRRSCHREPPEATPVRPPEPPKAAPVCPPPEPVAPPPKPAKAPPRRSAPPKTEQKSESFLKNLLPGDFDTGDLLVILLLLLMAGDSQEGKANALLTIAMYFLL